MEDANSDVFLVCGLHAFFSRSVAGVSVVPRPARLDDVEILKHLQPNPADSDHSTLQQMFLPDGFKADLIASEPDLLQPIALLLMSWGGSGWLRLSVILKNKLKGRGRIGS
jgi:hypothetical protein